MNLKLSGSDNISSYMAAISRLKSKALSIVLKLCEAESVSYLDEVASNTTTHNMTKLDSRYWLQSLRQVFLESMKSWLKYEMFLRLSAFLRSQIMDVVEALAVVAALEDLQFITILVQGICWLRTKFKHVYETWRQHIAGGKLKEITEEAKIYSIGKKALAALFVHTPAGALQGQIRNWLVENFDFLSIADDMAAGATGQLEILSTAIMDGWMAGLGAAQPPTTDALGQLSEYARYLYTSQLQHL
ncbi:hypothetical protein SASPL_120816 [Salvia splendens]|uniref:Nodulin homeobox N-terminal domain-containing protein n=1 Tax=Salvia splendens TaxID=180675 RepID=A0A8X8XTQ4_SALSN|nr:hypothetical protein SASPL_120816 [Salvia splendens]